MASRKRSEQGFTLVELLVSMTVLVMMSLVFLVFFKSALFDYLNLQTDATNLTELSTQEMRLGNVIRGLTIINSASANNLSMYAYFNPNDTYVSLVDYYLQQNGKSMDLLASVTPMTANPPIGTPLTSQMHTYTIMDDYYEPSNVSLFTYLDDTDSPIALPISNLEEVKAIQINLGTPLTNGGKQAINVQVTLRNRETN